VRALFAENKARFARAEQLWPLVQFVVRCCRSYVVIVTASGFNIVAMVCCEAYAFSERSGSRHHVAAGVSTSKNAGSLGCAVFGVLMVYIGSVIVHLGPTIIGGDFNYNDVIGNCIFAYGTIKVSSNS